MRENVLWWDDRLEAILISKVCSSCGEMTVVVWDYSAAVMTEEEVSFLCSDCAEDHLQE